PRKLGLHLRNVAAEVVKNFFCRCGDVFWICLERSPVRSKVGKACLLGDDQHLGLDAFHFVKAKLMYFIGGHVRGSAAVNVILVALLPVRKRGDCKSGAALRRVFLADECREALISRDDISVDRIRDLLRQALLIFRGDAYRIFLCGKKKWICVDNALALHWNFLKKEPDRHQLVFHSGTKDLRGLGEDARDLM